MGPVQPPGWRGRAGARRGSGPCVPAPGARCPEAQMHPLARGVGWLRAPPSCVPHAAGLGGGAANQWPSACPFQGISQDCCSKCNQEEVQAAFFLENSLPPLRPHHPAITRSVSLMELRREIKVSQISVLLHNVPDTPFCKQIFLFFWLKDV